MNNLISVLCLSNEHYPELIFGKVYRAEVDPHTQETGYIRVFGESEGYLYPASWFAEIQLPKEVENRLYPLVA